MGKELHNLGLKPASQPPLPTPSPLLPQLLLGKEAGLLESCC